MSVKGRKKEGKARNSLVSKLSRSEADKEEFAKKIKTQRKSTLAKKTDKSVKTEKTVEKKAGSKALKEAKSNISSKGAAREKTKKTSAYGKESVEKVTSAKIRKKKKSTPRKRIERKPSAGKVAAKSELSATAGKSSVQRIVVERSLAKGLENLKEKVEASKFFTPIRPVHDESELRDLPNRYGTCRIVCLVRDPYWIHTYWEITEDRLREAERFFGEEWSRTKTMLRVHDITGVDFDGDNSKSFFDIEISGGAESWYINVNSPNTGFVVDIIRIGPTGKVFVLARSNAVTTPRDGMSDILDEKWMSLDFDKMYALSGGFKIGATSAEMNEMMRERLMSDVSSWGGSGAVSSFGGSPVAVKRRGFWFMLDCELIVYGATEPDAKVIMQGHPVQLRPDGTFTVRFALPDGIQKIETTAISADGVEERTITPTVKRDTESKSKILKEV